MWLSVSLVWLRNYFSDESTSWRKLVGILEEFLSVEHVGAIWWPYLFTVKIEIVDHAPFVCRIVSKAEIALSNSIICSMYRVCEWKVYNCWTFFGFMIFDALVIGGIVRHSWDLWCLIDKLLLNKLQNSTAFLEWRSKLNLNTFFFYLKKYQHPAYRTGYRKRENVDLFLPPSEHETSVWTLGSIRHQRNSPCPTSCK